MSGQQLRAAVAGLLGFAAAQEQVLLAAAAGSEGSPQNWAPVPLVAHSAEFRRQQVIRLQAIRNGSTPPEFAEVDHESAALYSELSALPADAVARESWRVAGELLAELHCASIDDLLNPSRHDWLRGRKLWLQIVVRGFWHPAGHLGDYYLGHGRPQQALALAAQAVSTADSLGAPAEARGMASYNLACAQARAGLPDAAVATAAQAVSLNPDLRANLSRDTDLAALRTGGRLAAVLAR